MAKISAGTILSKSTLSKTMLNEYPTGKNKGVEGGLWEPLEALSDLSICNM